MYHPGKVLSVLSSNDKNIKSCDDTTQVFLEMWDENLVTFLVEPTLSKKIKEGDIALVDYRPTSDKIPVPKQTVVKVLSGKLGQNIWNSYKKFHEKKKMELPSNMPGNPAQNYMG